MQLKQSLPDLLKRTGSNINFCNYIAQAVSADKIIQRLIRRLTDFSVSGLIASKTAECLEHCISRINNSEDCRLIFLKRGFDVAIKRKCPRCGSSRVQLSSERSKHGCLWAILFGMYYIVWIMFKWSIGLCILFVWDWWMAIIKKASGKGYVWQSKKWFSGKNQVFYCHNCGYNFRA